MSKFASYRNTSVYIPNTAYINISKEVAAYNVSKGLLFPIQNTPCPPNQMCAQVVRYSYVNPCAYVTQPCPQYAAQITEYVPSDAKIYSVMPDCPPNARCIPTLYAAKGKVNPVLEMPSGKTKYIVTKTNEFTSPPFKVGDIFEGTLDGRNITTSQIMFEGKPTNFTFILGVDAKEYNSNNIGSMLTKKFDNIALGMLAATWGINGYLAYKFWAKSMMWKVGIVAATAANTYSTLKYLKKRKENTDQNTAPTTEKKN